MGTSETDRPPTEYGPWERGNTGQVGRTVTTWHRSFFDDNEWVPVVNWEPAPGDEHDAR
jgi:hypothetical protein